MSRGSTGDYRVSLGGLLPSRPQGDGAVLWPWGCPWLPGVQLLGPWRGWEDMAGQVRLRTLLIPHRLPESLSLPKI